MAADLLFDLFRCDRHFVVDQNIPQDALGEGFVRFFVKQMREGDDSDEGAFQFPDIILDFFCNQADHVV